MFVDLSQEWVGVEKQLFVAMILTNRRRSDKMDSFNMHGGKTGQASQAKNIQPAGKQ